MLTHWGPVICLIMYAAAIYLYIQTHNFYKNIILIVLSRSRIDCGVMKTRVKHKSTDVWYKLNSLYVQM